MALKLTILGCGSSGGVPRIGGESGEGNWGNCDPSEKKNRRSRCSVLIEKTCEKSDQKNVTRVLIDAGADMREQLLRHRVGHLDAVVITHEHADHIHGLDDLRMIALQTQAPVPVYLSCFAEKIILDRFRYCFFQSKNSMYPPILKHHIISPDVSFTVSGKGGDIDILPLQVHHGSIDSLGFRIGRLAYIPDMHDMPLQTQKRMTHLEYWIIDALRYQYHVAHLSVEQALEWLAYIQPMCGILTNMHIDLDYQNLVQTLPETVIPAYDGMTIDFSET